MAEAHPSSLREVSAVILAGGRGSRMDGRDKGLQSFQGRPLVQHALERLRAQGTGPNGHADGHPPAALAQIFINAKRNLAQYQALGLPVWPDDASAGADVGPLAGFLCGLRHCATPYLLTVPCDSPWLPLDLAPRLLQALQQGRFDIAMAAAPDATGVLRTQPVFCLLRLSLAEPLHDFLHQGGRKIAHWTRQQRTVQVDFNRPGDQPLAFCNINTLAQLQALEHTLAHAPAHDPQALP